MLSERLTEAVERNLFLLPREMRAWPRLCAVLAAVMKEWKSSSLGRADVWTACHAVFRSLFFGDLASPIPEIGCQVWA